MHQVAIIGAGKIGRMATHMLASSGDYAVRVADSAPASVEHLTRTYAAVEGRVFDFHDVAALDSLLHGAQAVISCAPFHCNPLIAERARAAKVHYLDLTEDVAVTKRVVELSHGADTVFAPQCGLAPGFITIVAMHLIRPMTGVSDLRLRVGALPRFPANQLKYNLTWSTEGLINEYCNPCEALVDGRLTTVSALAHLERLTIDGVEYEAFNTSGGLGTLGDSLKGRVRNVNYKTIRYPGHNRLMRFLLHDLDMRDHREELSRIFERSLPTTYQDQVVIFVSATGLFRGRLTERTYAKTIFHKVIDKENWSGIQITTASGVCTVLDLLLSGTVRAKGLLRMEEIDYDAFVRNRFGQHYA